MLRPLALVQSLAMPVVATLLLQQGAQYTNCER